MTKPNFSLLTVFWLVLAACGFMAGRVSTRGKLQEFEARAVKAEIAADDAQSLQGEVRDLSNLISRFFDVIENLGQIRIQSGRCLRVTDSNDIVFEEYDSEGKTLSQSTVELAFLAFPPNSSSEFDKARKLLDTYLDADAYVVVITPLDSSSQTAPRSMVATQSAANNYRMEFLQHLLLSQGLARLDQDGQSVQALQSAESEAKSQSLGIWQSE